MKKIIILVVILALLFVGDLYFLKNSSNKHLVSIFPTPNVSSENNTLGFCKPQDLDANLTTQGAAGNIFGTLTIKNTSTKNCQIISVNFILPSFDAKNITVKNQGQTGPETFTLSPNQIVYSQIHYPNGPQCSGQISQANISYSYKISVNDSVNFKNQNGSTKQTIGVCQSSSEITEVDVWSLSKKPVNQ